jgi:MMPL family
VFIVSRIREAFQRGAGMDEAISVGIKSTAGVVTSAAVVMVGVFSIFGTLSLLMFKHFGVGLAAAILIDATLVRGVLLPATMKLLGERNWYLPRWLEWLPRFEPGSRLGVARRGIPVAARRGRDPSKQSAAACAPRITCQSLQKRAGRLRRAGGATRASSKGWRRCRSAPSLARRKAPEGESAKSERVALHTACNVSERGH